MCESRPYIYTFFLFSFISLVSMSHCPLSIEAICLCLMRLVPNLPPHMAAKIESTEMKMI